LTSSPAEPNFACQKVPGARPLSLPGKGGAVGLGPGLLGRAAVVTGLSHLARDPAGMRPALRAGLLPLWRGPDTIQIGVDPRRAVALTGVGAAAALFGLLDGSRDRDQLVAAAGRLGIPEALAEQTLTHLASAGLLIDFPAALLRALEPETRAQLLPEMAGASLARQDADGGAQVLARRAAANVRIRGRGRIAAAITDVLTASGVTVAPVQDGRPKPASRQPPPTLVILAGQLPGPAARLMRPPHLAVTADEAIGVVGPLVRPGVSACLRCLDLTRADLDPAWPLILAQVTGRRAEPTACGAALAAAVAAQAATQTLMFIDQPAAVAPAENATLELVQPGWEWRRRTWAAHPACTCRASDRR
jgi:hypothetical protein